MVVGPDDQIMKVVTPCPESPGQWPEYPGVTMHPTRPPSSPRLAVRCRARSSTASAAGEAPAMLGSMGRSTPSTDGWVGVPVAGASRCSRIRSVDDAASAFGDRGVFTCRDLVLFAVSDWDRSGGSTLLVVLARTELGSETRVPD